LSNGEVAPRLALSTGLPGVTAPAGIAVARKDNTASELIYGVGNGITTNARSIGNTPASSKLPGLDTDSDEPQRGGRAID
jgi:hypothetical protein